MGKHQRERARWRDACMLHSYKDDTHFEVSMKPSMLLLGIAHTAAFSSIAFNSRIKRADSWPLECKNGGQFALLDGSGRYFTPDHVFAQTDPLSSSTQSWHSCWAAPWLPFSRANYFVTSWTRFTLPIPPWQVASPSARWLDLT